MTTTALPRGHGAGSVALVTSGADDGWLAFVAPDSVPAQTPPC